MLSFIIPAHNEEALIGETLRILRASAEQLGIPFEIIVADDASTDTTAAIARSQGATVVSTNRRQISAVRNAGAKVARGEILIFVDADTHVSSATLRQAVDAVHGGAVGGGSVLRTEANAPLWARATFAFLGVFMRARRWAAGCFVFVRRADFDAVGGFDERYFATEELVLSEALKKRGRMVIVRDAVVTSARKARLYGAAGHAKVLLRFALRGTRVVQSREHLQIWYDGRREP